MKKIFPIIIGLISLSLVGIIVIQVLWLKNMVLLRQEQMRHRIQDGVTLAGNTLVQHKSNYNYNVDHRYNLAKVEKQNELDRILDKNEDRQCGPLAFHQQA